MSAYLLVSLHTSVLHPERNQTEDASAAGRTDPFTAHRNWDEGEGWKNWLNNLRLILQPYVFFNLLKPWLEVFSIPSLITGFTCLVELMNSFPGAIPTSTRAAPTPIPSG